MAEKEKVCIDWARVRRLFLFSLIGLGAILALLVIYRALLLSLIFSLILAYLLMPAQEWVSTQMAGRRGLSAIGLIAGLLLIIVTLVASIMPMIYHQLLEIIKRLPAAMQYLTAMGEPVKRFLVDADLVQPGTIESAVEDFNVLTQVGGQVKGIMEKMWASTPTLLGGVLTSALIPLLLFFILKDFPKLKKIVTAIIPYDLIDSFHHFEERANRKLRSVLKGQLIVAMILAVLYMIGLGIIGLEFGVAIGAAAGICRIVPYLDVLVGLSLSFVVILTKFTSIGQVIGVCLIFLVVQILDGTLITPKVVGGRAGLHPGVVIVSVIALGDWFGFVGVLMAVPIVALLNTLLESLTPIYLGSPFYLGEISSEEGNPPE